MQEVNLQKLRTEYPDVSVEGLYPQFPRLQMSDYPSLNAYSWEQCHHGFMGGGGLFLVSEVADRLDLKSGSLVLDLACGNCASSIFLAKHYGVDVVAIDTGADPAVNRRLVSEAGLAHQVTPIKMDARDLLLPHQHFDAVFCMNSYFYFGTDADYLPYLTRFLKRAGRIGIGSPCYAAELTEGTPTEFLYDAPDFTESNAVHSPSWWREHFERSGGVSVRVCEENPLGREFWLDDIRWLLESTHPREMSPEMRDMVLQQIVMLLTDHERFVTYMTLIAENEQE